MSIGVTSYGKAVVFEFANLTDDKMVHMSFGFIDTSEHCNIKFPIDQLDRMIQNLKREQDRLMDFISDANANH